MFDFFAMILSSIGSFLFPIFASYKALKTSDPAQLTPWLMYWVVFSCCMLVESWLSVILFWVPFYGYIRLLFLLYLILPQTQGARIIYEERIHPFLEHNEAHIDEFIASAHDRLKAAGIAYLKQAIEYLKTNILGLPPTETPPPTPVPSASGQAQTYTQTLLSRFSVPAARWSAPTNAGTEFYNLLAGAVSTVTGAAGNTAAPRDLIPSNLKSSGEKMSFITAQLNNLNILTSALNNAAQELQRGQNTAAERMDTDGGGDDDHEETQRPPSGLSMWSGLSKNRSEADFEKIDAQSDTEDYGSLRRRNAPPAAAGDGGGGGGGGWMPWNWGGGGDVPGTRAPDAD